MLKTLQKPKWYLPSFKECMLCTSFFNWAAVKTQIGQLLMRPADDDQKPQSFLPYNEFTGLAENQKLIKHEMVVHS